MPVITVHTEAASHKNRFMPNHYFLLHLIVRLFVCPAGLQCMRVGMTSPLSALLVPFLPDSSWWIFLFIALFWALSNIFNSNRMPRYQLSKNTPDSLIDWLGTKNEVMKKELKHKVKDLESAKANQIFQKLQLDIKSLKKNPESTWKN